VRVFITGDTHGEFYRIREFCRAYHTNKDDILIILGDAGLNYHLQGKDDRLKHQVSQLPITLLCVHGNHEERPYNVEGYKEEQFMGGTVYVEDKFPNLLFTKDGSVYNINGKKYLAIGGAYSVDKEYRIEKGYQWFMSEQPTFWEKQRIEFEIDNCNWKVDYVLTHTCPYNVRPTHLFLNCIDQSKVDSSMEEWLQGIANKLKFKKWYFGHFHGDWIIDNYEMLFTTIKEIE